MEIIYTENRQERTRATVQIVVEQIRTKPDSVIIFPVDTTHAEFYAELGNLCQSGEISFKDARAFHLDEYVGVQENDPKCFRRMIKEKLFTKTDFKPENVFYLDGSEEDLEKVCQDYEEKLEKCGPVDLCILGIGRNGHIAFDEPGIDPNLGVHIQKLSDETVAINHGPSEAVTMGIRNILKAKKIILSADGEAKAEAIKTAIEGPINNNCPASLLREHNDITFIIDKSAANLLKNEALRRG